MSFYVTRQAARSRDIPTLIGSVGPVSLGLGVLGMLLAFPVASLLAEGRSVVSTWLTAGLLLLPVYLFSELLQGLAQGLERWSVLIMARLTPALIWLLGIVVLYIAGNLTVANAAVLTIVGGVAAMLPALPIVWGMSRPRLRPSVAREGVSFGVKAWIGRLSDLVANHQLAQVLMINFVAARQLGLYVVAVTLSQAPSSLTAAISQALSPRVARGSLEITARTLRTMIALFVPASLVLSLLSPVLVPLLFGSEFEDAVPITWILLAAMVPGQCSYILGTALVGGGAPGSQAKGSVLGVIVTLVGLALLLGRLEAVGAAIVALLAASTQFLYLLFKARTYFGGSLHEFLVVKRSDVTWALETGRLYRRSRRGRPRP